MVLTFTNASSACLHHPIFLETQICEGNSVFSQQFGHANIARKSSLTNNAINSCTVVSSVSSSRHWQEKKKERKKELDCKHSASTHCGTHTDTGIKRRLSVTSTCLCAHTHTHTQSNRAFNLLKWVTLWKNKTNVQNNVLPKGFLQVTNEEGFFFFQFVIICEQCVDKKPQNTRNNWCAYCLVSRKGQQWASDPRIWAVTINILWDLCDTQLRKSFYFFMIKKKKKKNAKLLVAKKRHLSSKTCDIILNLLSPISIKRFLLSLCIFWSATPASHTHTHTLMGLTHRLATWSVFICAITQRQQSFCGNPGKIYTNWSPPAVLSWKSNNHL